MKGGKTLLLISVLALISCAWGMQNNRPIIGILTLPMGGESPGLRSYLSASYVKFVEQAGGRVSPIPYDADESTLRSLFSSINGLLFTGGGLSLNLNTSYYKAADLLWNAAEEANRRGDIFPIWGTCMGFQLQAILATSNHSFVRSGFDSENLALSLRLEAGWEQSRLLGSAPSGVITTLTEQRSTINLHHDGVEPASVRSSKLGQYFQVLATNVDRQEREFVSAWEARDFPFYGTQFHPERPAFEWDTAEALDHSPEAEAANLWLARRLVGDARKNGHAFPSKAAEEAALIYQSVVTYTGNDPNQNFPDRQTYYWPGTA